VQSFQAFLARIGTMTDSSSCSSSSSKTSHPIDDENENDDEDETVVHAKARCAHPPKGQDFPFGASSNVRYE
jgi:hypothetical protein